jgi:hypothetical protein
MSIATVFTLVLVSFFVVVPTQMPTVRAYVTPGTGVVWNMDDLVLNAGGDVVGTFPNYLIRNDLTITGGPLPDTVYMRAGEIVDIRVGLAVTVEGIFLSQAVMGPIEFRSENAPGEPQDWIGFVFNPGSTGRFEGTWIRHADTGIRINDADVTVRSGLIESNYPYGIYFDSGMCQLNNSFVQGSPPPSSGLSIAGGMAIYATGVVSDTLWLNQSTIIGGNGAPTGTGGDAIYTINLDGPIGVIGNKRVQGGAGGYNNVDLMAAGAGGMAFHAWPVWDMGPVPSINISGNQLIRGGNGGTNNASFDGSSGGGAIGITISDDDSFGSIRITNNMNISGGDGGDNFADWGGGFFVEHGGPGVSLNAVGGLSSVIAFNPIISGGKGGNNSGTSTIGTPVAGFGGMGVILTDTGGVLVMNNRITGGHGGNNTVLGAGVQAGRGGIGLLSDSSGDIRVRNSFLKGGEGGDDYAGLGPGFFGGSGSGSIGMSSLDTSGRVSDSYLQGGEGGDAFGPMGDGGFGGYGVYVQGPSDQLHERNDIIGGKGGDTYHAAGNSAGQGTYAIYVNAVSGLTFSYSNITAGAGGDCYQGANAIPGIGGNSMLITDLSNSINLMDNPLITVGLGGVNFLTGASGSNGSIGVRADDFTRNVRISRNYISNATWTGIYSQSPGLLVDGNTIDGNFVGIVLASTANWANITGNPSIGNGVEGIELQGSDNVTIENNLIENLQTGIRGQMAQDVHVDRTQIMNADVWGIALDSQTDRFLVENSTIASPIGGSFAVFGSNATTLNTTFNGAFVSITPDANLTVMNYLHVKVLDQTLADIPNADVEVLDNGAQVYATPGFAGTNATTDVNGEVNWIVITDRIYAMSSIATENTTDAQVSEGLRIFLNNPRSVDMSTSHQEVFVEMGPDIEPPETHNVLLDGVKFRTVAAGTPVDITAVLDDPTPGGSAIFSANYTVFMANWPGNPMNAMDGAFDSVVEDVVQTIDTTGWMPGSYPIWVYGCDDLLNCNITGDFATLNITGTIDNEPPDILNVLANNLPSVNVLAGTLVDITATVDDGSTGNSIILNGNYTISQDNWPGTLMNPADGAFDGTSEDVDVVIDTTGWSAGSYDIWVYGCDVTPNCNTTGNFATINIVLESQPPEISDVFADGAPSRTYQLSVLPATFTLTGVIDDEATGGTAIGGANYTSPAATWPGTLMNPFDGAFDSPVETATIQLSTPTVPGTYQYCVYGWDQVIPPNYNTTGSCATITVEDDMVPNVLNVRLNGGPSVSVPAGALVDLDASIDDLANGGSDIWDAYWSESPPTWPGIAMNPVDGTFDGPAEDVDAVIDTTGWTQGDHIICVNARDVQDNRNTTCLNNATLTITTVGDTTPPSVTDTNPDDEDTDVAIDVPIIEVEFDEPMDEASVDVDLDSISFSGSWDGNTFIITPLEDLEYDTEYTVTVTNAEDLAGNPLGTYEFTFTTETEPVTPPPDADVEDLTWLWLLLIILAVIIGLLLFLLLRKRKPAEEELMAPEEPVEELIEEEEEAPAPIDELEFDEEAPPEESEILEDEY